MFTLKSSVPGTLIVLLLSVAAANAGEGRELLIVGGSRQLGDGYDSKSETPRGNCFVNQESLKIIYGETQRSSTDFGREMSQTSLESEFGFQLESRARFGMTSASADLSYLESLSETDVMDSFNIVYDVTAKEASFDRTGKGVDLLVPVYRDLLKKTGGTYRLTREFLETCGDEYIKTALRGIRLYVTTTVRFSQASQKKEFDAKVGAKGSWGNFSFDASSLSHKTLKSGTVSLVARQIGGDAGKISDIFRNHGGPSGDPEYSILECSLENLKACKGAQADLITYVRKLQEQISNQEYNPYQSGTSLGTFGYRTAAWSELGILGADDPIEESLYAMRGEVSTAFEVQLKRYRHLIHHQNGQTSRSTLSLDEKADLAKTLDSVRKNLDTLSRTKSYCYDQSDVTKCRVAVDQAIDIVKKRTVNEDWFKSAAQLCKSTGCTQCVKIPRSLNATPEYTCLSCTRTVGEINRGGALKLFEGSDDTDRNRVVSCTNMLPNAAAQVLAHGMHGNCGYKKGYEWWGDMWIKATLSSSGDLAIDEISATNQTEASHLAHSVLSGVVPETGVISVFAGSGTCQSEKFNQSQSLDPDFYFEISTPELIRDLYGE